eukprot:TRINITY_DN3597_c0_g1_i1.p1 TRINITY_DN3597_c0_g1~~TRINITY_DN3597_c0_g1_i1.p1  ORF type:complete len:671 (+),score=71.01 TRINITY_DN3597_c0_g1_i1:232-2013(+)
MDPKSERVYVNDRGVMLNLCDPDHSTPATTSKIFGADAVARGDFTNASMIGFIEWENKRGFAHRKWCDVLSMQAYKEHTPIMSTLGSEFAIMDRFFAAYPGPTWPNRLFMLSATSAGLTETGPWYHNIPGKLFPQETIFDQITKSGLTWRNYYNDTPWELFLNTMAHAPENLATMGQFFEDARTGNLPSFSWINPLNGINFTLGLGSNDQHPDHDVALGEAYYKDIYEALRSSPAWNDTLFVITYDEHGGFYDHVSTPLNVPPPGDGETSYPDPNVKFDRLGIRIPTLLISPWIPKGLVISEPPAAQKPAPNSEYDLTSIMATTRKLLNMQTGPLTKRDAWSGTFEHALSLSSPRTDCPVHLPPAPKPSHDYSLEKEAEMEVNDLQAKIIEVHAHLAGVPVPKDEVTKQGHVNEWQQRHYAIHAHKTAHWKQTKVDPRYTLICRPGPVETPTKWIANSWNITKGRTVHYNTFPLRNFKDQTTQMCLDYGQGKPEPGRLLGVSACYPSADPDMNRDPGQQWVLAPDATIRPAADGSLCLTTNFLQGDTDHVRLQRCADSNAQQHWSYGGAAPGNGRGDGSLDFGQACLGIIDTI